MIAATTIQVPHVNYLSILPTIILFVGATILMAVTSLLPPSKKLPLIWTTTITVGLGVAALVASLFQWRAVSHFGPTTTIAHAISFDGFSVFVAVLVSCCVIVSALASHGYLETAGLDSSSYQILGMISASGAIIMGQANDLVVIFLGLEILSLALYVLVAMNHRREASSEAALKYFILGGFASAIFVYGIALTYGATGSTNITQIASFLSGNVLGHNGLLLAGLALLLVGFGFKVAAVPFHMWTPDVYEGAPTPVTGFMAAVAKVGGFAAFLRVFASALGSQVTLWHPLVYTIIIATVLLGAIVAVVQTNIKRMLAYSSINHAGFIMLGLVGATAAGVSASLYYLFAYAFMTIGTFALVTAIGGPDDDRHDLASYRGLGKRQPLLALSLTVLLLAQAGAPFTTGFWAKFGVIAAAVNVGAYPLAVIAMVSAAIATYFYLRVAVVMYAGTPEQALVAVGDVGEGDLLLKTEPTTSTETIVVAPATAAAVAICLFVTIGFGLFPELLLNFAHEATLLFIG